MYNRKELKREAKQLMRASTPHYMLVALVYILLTTGLNYIVTALTGMGTILAGALSVFLNILVALFSMVMAVGFSNYALRLSRKQQTSMGDLFEAFSFAGRSIGMTLLTVLYTFLWTMLVLVCFGVVIAVAAFLMDHVPALGIILMVVAYIALLVAIVWIALRYAMAPFALVENPENGAVEAVRRSVRMMRGHKGKLFVLELSFLGWELLVALISLAVTVIGLFVGGTVWLLDSLLAYGGDWFSIYSTVGTLMGQLSLWVLLAGVLSLPLTMWLSVYFQTALARFYNYVSGYDYHVYMNGECPFEPDPSAPEAPVEEPAQEPKEPPAGGYYNSVLPPESTQEEAQDEDEEI